jgi:hypothetical protein
MPTRDLCSDVAAVRELEAKADVLMGQGSFAAALPYYEKILNCKPGLLTKVHLASCRTKQFEKAKAYFRQFPAQRQDALAQICMKEGFDPRKEPYDR